MWGVAELVCDGVRTQERSVTLSFARGVWTTEQVAGLSSGVTKFHFKRGACHPPVAVGSKPSILEWGFMKRGRVLSFE